MSTEDRFEQLIAEFLAQMARVKCPTGEYIAALGNAIEEIRTEKQAAEETS